MKVIVNPSGTVHTVNDDYEVKFPFREASEEEIGKWFASQGLNPDGSPVQAAKGK